MPSLKSGSYIGRFDDEKMKRRYQDALKSKVSGFVECVSGIEHAGTYCRNGVS